MNLKDHLSKTAFWDINFETLDVDEKSSFVIDKVFNYGKWADILAIHKYYGEEKIKNEIVKAPWLRKEVISFVSLVYDLKLRDFKCYLRRQSHPTYFEF